MKKLHLISAIGFFVMFALGLTNSIISYFANGTFAYFEIFYFVCVLAAGFLMLSVNRVKMHELAAIIIASVGLIANTLVWSSTGYDSNPGSAALNGVMVAVVFLGLVYFLHSYFKVFSLQKFIWISCSVFGLFLIGMATYAFVSSLILGKGTLSGASLALVITSALSLISCLGIPLAEYLVITKKEN